MRAHSVIRNASWRRFVAQKRHTLCSCVAPRQQELARGPRAEGAGGQTVATLTMGLIGGPRIKCVNANDPRTDFL
jgi:hypothetical protein